MNHKVSRQTPRRKKPLHKNPSEKNSLDENVFQSSDTWAIKWLLGLERIFKWSCSHFNLCSVGVLPSEFCSIHLFIKAWFVIRWFCITSCKLLFFSIRSIGYLWWDVIVLCCSEFSIGLFSSGIFFSVSYFTFESISSIIARTLYYWLSICFPMACSNSPRAVHFLLRHGHCSTHQVNESVKVLITC